MLVLDALMGITASLFEYKGERRITWDNDPRFFHQHLNLAASETVQAMLNNINIRSTGYSCSCFNGSAIASPVYIKRLVSSIDNGLIYLGTN